MIRDNDLIVPRKRLGKRLRAHDNVKVSGRFRVGDTDGLMGLRQDLVGKRPSRKLGYVD